MMVRWLRSALPFVSLRAVGQGMELIGWVALARELQPHVFGRLSIAFLVARYLGVLGDWGFSSRGVRDAVAANAGHLSSALRQRSVISLFASIGYAVVAVGSRETEFAVLGVVVLAGGMNRDWIALAAGRSRMAALPSVLQGSLIVIGALSVGASSAPGAAPYVIATSYAVALCLSIVVNRVRSSTRGQVFTDGWMLLAVLSFQVMFSFDTLFIGMWLSSAKAGIYAAAARLPTAVTTLASLLSTVAIASAARAVTERPEQMANVARRALKTALVSGLGMTVLIPAIYFGMPLLYGGSFSAGAPAASLLMLAAAISTAASPLAPVFIVQGNDRAYGVQHAIAAGINVIANIVLIPLWGINGAAIALILARMWITVFLLRKTVTFAALQRDAFST